MKRVVWLVFSVLVVLSLFVSAEFSSEDTFTTKEEVSATHQREKGTEKEKRARGLKALWKRALEEVKKENKDPLKFYYSFDIYHPFELGRGYISNKTDFQDVKLCRNCHTEFYLQWSDSAHARSYRGAMFQFYYKKHLEESGMKNDPECLKCHAPAAYVSGDYDVQIDTHRDGVYCDYCHTLKIVTEMDITSNPSAIKIGPMMPDETNIAPHGVTLDSHIRSSIVCKACHDKVNAYGVPEFDEYTWWRGSDFANDGYTCQTCHMPPYRGEDVKAVVRDNVPAHIFLGASPAMLQSTIAMEAESERDENNPEALHIKVKVENTTCAHPVPGSSPWHQLILITRVYDENGKVIWAQREDIRRVFLDEDGNITYEHWKAAKVYEDTRLRPGETREYTYKVKIPVDQDVKVESRIFLIVKPREITDETQTEIKKPIPIDSAVSLVPSAS